VFVYIVYNDFSNVKLVKQGRDEKEKRLRLRLRLRKIKFKVQGSGYE